MGAMMARYLKVFKAANPAWFYLHIVCQSSAYIVGVAGWATGIKLGNDSSGITYDAHRNIGIALFCLGTIQVIILYLISYFSLLIFLGQLFQLVIFNIFLLSPSRMIHSGIFFHSCPPLLLDKFEISETAHKFLFTLDPSVI